MWVNARPSMAARIAMVGSLVVIGPSTSSSNHWPFDGFYLYYPSRLQVPPKLRAFIEHLRACVERP